METFPNILIRASAGTGKTFQLSNRFIKLLHCGVLPDQILAVTFTRMAAGEILDRVMLRLASAAANDDDCRALQEAIGDPTLNRNRCLDLLEQLTLQLHRIRVDTLDGYFARLARSFSLELGLPPGWSIIEEVQDQQLRTQSIQSLLRNDAYQLSAILKWLFKGEAERSITQELLNVIWDLYNLFRESEKPAWERFPETNPLSVAELKEAIRDLQQVEHATDKRIDKAYQYELGQAIEKDWEKFIEKGNVKNIIAGNETYYKKAYSAETLAVYRRLIDHAQAVLISDLAGQTLATYQLLELFDREYVVEKNNARAFRFEDITYRLSHFVGIKEMHSNHFRLDSQISHLLLDEFQDTSLDQWNVIRPLARQLTNPEDQQSFFFMGGKTSFFCVGDPKQAIYGWRGGRAEIFDALPEQLGELEESNLVKSYRSSQPVIDVVNRVFKEMNAHKNLGRAKEAVDQWCEQFPEHETDKTELPGFVQLETGAGPELEGENWSDANLRIAAERIREVHDATEGYSIGVLVRKNASLARIVGHLRSMGIPASEERGGNQLSDSAAVQLILSLIKIADHPGNSVARFHLATSVLANEIELTSHRDDAAALNLSRRIRRQLSVDGYGKTLSFFADRLSSYCNLRQRRRLQQLVQLGYSYQQNATLRPTNFVHFVENKRVPDPTNARIRVMTVHQAKGLEFDIVFLPDLDGQLISRFKECVYRRESPSKPVSQISRRCRKEIRTILPPELLELFDQATLEDVTGELCLLYVALTRAIHALHVVIQPGHQRSQTVSRLLTNALAADIEKFEPKSQIYSHGDPEWFKNHSNETVSDETSAVQRLTVSQSIHFRSPPEGRFKDWPIRSPSMAKRFANDPPSRTETGSPLDVHARQVSRRVSAQNLLNLQNLESAARGTLYHQWLQLIDWMENGIPRHEQMINSARSTPLGMLNLESEIDGFQSILGSGQMQSLLSRTYYREQHAFLDSKVQVDDIVAHNEFPFVYRDDTELVSGTIDRLILWMHQGRVVGADIIDYKTDVLDPNSRQSIDSKVESYRGQMHEYGEAIRHIYQLESNQISKRLFFVNYDLLEMVIDDREGNGVRGNRQSANL